MTSESMVHGGAFGTDTADVIGQLTDADRSLAALPPKPDRTGAQQAEAERIILGARVIRDRFIQRYADAVYDHLTDDRQSYLRVSELVFRAGQVYPGLVPDAAQWAAEAALPTADRDGREIDQGIFVAGLLRSPVPGRHLIAAMMRPTDRALALHAAFLEETELDVGSVAIERQDAIAHVTINNQYCLNAEDNRLVADLETAIDLVLLHPVVRVGVLRGGVMSHPRYDGKRVFSAGINLRHLHQGRISLIDFLLGRELGALNKMMRGILPEPAAVSFAGTVHKPWIAVVDSFAIGGGMQMLLTADAVIAADDAYFSLPAAQEGIVPGLANLRLGRYTGGRLSRRLILGGRALRATDPEASAICDEVVPTADLDGVVAATATRLTHPAVVANRQMLHEAEEPIDAFRAYLAEFAVVQAYRLYSGDVLDRIGREWG